MRILYLTARQFWPIDSGGKLRDFHLARELAAHADVTYLGFADDKAPQPCPPALARSFASVIMEPRRAGHSVQKLVRGLVGKLPATVLNYTTAAMSEQLARLLGRERFDVVQMEGVHLAGYWDILKSSRPQPRIICDWHNIESELMRRYAQNAHNPAVRFYAEVTARRLERLEDLLLRECDAVLVPSVRERDSLLEKVPGSNVHVIENGVDTNFYSEVRPETSRAKSKNIIFVGSMDYHANIDAAVWFANEVWPALRDAHPDLRFKIVGRAPSDAVRALAGHPGVDVTGAVPDVRSYYGEALCAVVPLRVGGGTRLKILESMAAGTPVVSTTLGAEGLDAAAGRDLIISDTPEEICHAVTHLIEDEAAWRGLSEAGRQLVRAKYDWSAIGTRLFALHEQAIAREQAA